jgi:hypothetical protein
MARLGRKGRTLKWCGLVMSLLLAVAWCAGSRFLRVLGRIRIALSEGSKKSPSMSAIF